MSFSKHSNNFLGSIWILWSWIPYRIYFQETSPFLRLFDRDTIVNRCMYVLYHFVKFLLLLLRAFLLILLCNISWKFENWKIYKVRSFHLFPLLRNMWQQKWRNQKNIVNMSVFQFLILLEIKKIQSHLGEWNVFTLCFLKFSLSLLQI